MGAGISYKRSRLILFAGLVLTLFILTILASKSGDADSFEVIAEDGAAPAGERHDGAHGRYQAALASLQQEKARLEQAKLSFTADRTNTPTEPRHYLVSFTDAIPAKDLFVVLSEERNMELETVFVWLQADPTSIEIGVGEHSAHALNWFTEKSAATKAAEFLDRYYHAYLEGRSQDLKRVYEKGDSNPEAEKALNKQLKENDEVRSGFITAGVPLYGIRCTCSPMMLETLTFRVPGLSLRAVEPVDAYQFPLALRDPLRDLVIATGGRHGR